MHPYLISLKVKAFKYKEEEGGGGEDAVEEEGGGGGAMIVDGEEDGGGGGAVEEEVGYRYSNPMIQPEPEGSTQGYPLVSVEVLRFNTTAGNPVKKILLKLNLSDHRLFKDGGGGS
ncbi:hypothetical protein Tco_0436386 [Tanacetum coccineum]